MFILLYKSFAKELKVELGAWLTLVLLECLDSPNCSAQQKIDIVEALELIFNSAQKLVTLFYNYDNDSGHLKTYERLISILASIGSASNNVGGTGSVNLTKTITNAPTTSGSTAGRGNSRKLKDEADAKALQRMSLDLLVRILEMLSRWLVGKRRLDSKGITTHPTIAILISHTQKQVKIGVKLALVDMIHYHS